MVVQVHLHTVLQYQAATGRVSSLELQLPEGACVADVLRELDIQMAPEALILVINHRVVDVQAPLADGDRLDVVPAISGG